MRTTVTLDEEIVAKAAKLTGIEEHSSLVRAALETLVRVENGTPACYIRRFRTSSPGSSTAPRYMSAYKGGF